MNKGTRNRIGYFNLENPHNLGGIQVTRMKKDLVDDVHSGMISMPPEEPIKNIGFLR